MFINFYKSIKNLIK